MKMSFDKKYGTLYLKHTMEGRYFWVKNKMNVENQLISKLPARHMKINGCRQTVLNHGQLAPAPENGRSGN
jgi:hypothetical protein